METQNKELTAVQQKRQALREISKIAKQLLQTEAMEEDTVNEIVINQFYKNDTHQEFKSFKGWMKNGFAVKKGEKAFCIWGKPREKKETDPKEENEEGKKSKFYPLAYIFSNAQVEPLKKKESA